MGLAISILLGLLIFGYSAYMLWKMLRTSRKGKCAACAIKNACCQKDGRSGDNDPSHGQPIVFRSMNR
ncbi:FeoB-associated Cys-rich membrane protein [Sporolactobacillus sp. THM7-7]|nr:FeoB-associated Cys-rich membrane protein [Sporolactobacillus sp. THM7-7]